MDSRGSMIRGILVRRPLFLLLAILLLVPSLLFMARETIWACATAPRPGDYVGIADETALIIWDAESKTQHFIRRATFGTKAKDFGFLVPTPSKPELDEAHDYTFKMLERITAPERVTHLAIMRAAEPGEMAAANRTPGGVQVVESKRVGDFDAVVLKADDANALKQWLAKHGYAADAALTDWLKPYVAKQWFLTAFKIAKDAREQAPATASAVRMSFATDKPFFPYREPAGQRDASNPLSTEPRRLRVYVLAGTRMKGTLGDGSSHWPGTTVWAGTMPKAENDFLLYTLKIHNQVKGKEWQLTEFQDVSSPRPGTDEVYFSTAEDQSSVTRPPIIQHLIHNEAARGPLTPTWAFLLGGISGAVLLALVSLVVIVSRRKTGS